MNRSVRTTTPGGEEIVILPADRYERLVAAAEDARDLTIADRVLADFADMGGEVLTDAEMRALLKASHPLAFWRQRRDLTQASLATAVGVSQAYLAQIEKGRRVGDVDLYRRLAAQLRLDIEDLLPRSETRTKGAARSKRSARRRKK